MLPIQTATRQELLALPVRPWGEDRTYDSILIFPSRNKHESGYQKMIVIGVNDWEAVEIAANCPDDLKWFVPAELIKFQWNMSTDCMPKSKALHFWSRQHRFKIGHDFSSVDIQLINL